MQTNYFRINKKEYCHFTEDYIFITNTKTPTFIPEEHDLGESYSISSILNYIFFAFIMAYCFFAIAYYGKQFFAEPLNYAAIFLLILSMRRVQQGFNASKSPSINRSKLKNILFKTPKFSFPRLEIYFVGPNNKTLKRTISVLYKKEALNILEKENIRL